MKKMGMFFAVLLLISGCATARLNSGPSLMLTHYPQALNVGVGKAIDKRESATIGTIGATGVRVKQSDLSNILTNYIVQTLNSRMSVNVTPVAAVENSNAASIAKDSNTDRVVSIEVRKIKMFSTDAIMQPVEVNLEFKLTVYDKDGNQVYSTLVPGNFEKRIGITIVDKATGELVESTIKDAMDKMVIEHGLREALGSAKA